MDKVEFPAGADGRRSSSALGRAVVADALRAAGPAEAAEAERATDWRTGYLRPFRSLIEAGDGYAVARAGLESLHRRMAIAVEPDGPPRTVTTTGGGKQEQELILPYGGELLRGDGLHRRLDAWVAAGTIEPSCAEAVREVAANPDWLDLSDRTLVVLGSGAEMGPLEAVLGWGGTVVGLDLPRPELQARVRRTAEQSAGRLISAEADLLTGLPAVAGLLRGIDGPIVLGNYVYAPGGTYALLSAAVDALTVHLQQHRDDLTLALLATPTDVFAVPDEAVAQSRKRWSRRSARSRVSGALSGRRLLAPNYPGPAINDSLVPQQGPNYALAKRIQRWRAAVARRDGTPVSLSVAPPTRTRSVTGNRLLAAAYAGAHLFDVEVFEPATARKLMAALLVHQLRNPRPASDDPWRDETFGAAHGGLWRTAYLPRTALGLAAVRGLPAAVRSRPAPR